MTKKQARETLEHLMEWLTTDRTDRPDMADVQMAIGLALHGLEEPPGRIVCRKRDDGLGECPVQCDWCKDFAVRMKKAIENMKL
jgi:hypothetical protein